MASRAIMHPCAVSEASYQGRRGGLEGAGHMDCSDMIVVLIMDASMMIL